MDYQGVLYRLKGDVFEVRLSSDLGFNEEIFTVIDERQWNSFLDKYGSNPKPPKGRRRTSGSDSVVKEALYQLTK